MNKNVKVVLEYSDVWQRRMYRVYDGSMFIRTFTSGEEATDYASWWASQDKTPICVHDDGETRIMKELSPDLGWCFRAYDSNNKYLRSAMTLEEAIKSADFKLIDRTKEVIWESK